MAFDISLVFSAIGSCLSLGLFAGQIPLMRKLIKERDSSKYSAIPTLSTLATCVMWLGYCFSFQGARPDIVAINGVGIFPFCTVYIAILAWFHPVRAQRLRIVGMGLGIVVFAAALYCATVVSGALELSTARLICGLTADVINVAIFGSPILSIVTAYRELDPARVPVLFTVIGLMCALCWGTFGIVIADPFLMAPNFIGAVLSSSQLGVLWVIKRKRAALGPRFKVGEEEDEDHATAKGAGGTGLGGDLEKGRHGAAAAGAGGEGPLEDIVEIIPTVPAIAIVRSASLREKRRYAYSWNPPSDAAELELPRPTATAPGAGRLGGVDGIATVTSSTQLMASVTPSPSSANLACASLQSARGNGSSMSGGLDRDDGSKYYPHHHPQETVDAAEPVSMDGATHSEIEGITRALSRQASFRAASGGLTSIRVPSGVPAAVGHGTPALGPASPQLTGTGLSSTVYSLRTSTPKAD